MSNAKYTINNDTNNHDTRDLHKWAQQRAVSCVSCLTDDVSHHIGSSSLSLSLMSSACRTCVVVFDSLRPLFSLPPALVFSFSPCSCWPADWPPRPELRAKWLVPLRQGEPRRLWRHALPHRLWARRGQRHGLRWARLLPGSSRIHSACCSPKHTENTPYFSLEGVFVSQSSVSVASDRTGKPVARKNIDPFSFGVRNACSAHIHFLQSPKLKKWSIERGNFWEKALELLRAK